MDHVVTADHVVAQLRIQRAIALVGARRNPTFLDPADPSELVVVLSPASGAGERRGASFLFLVEEIALTESHSRKDTACGPV